MTTQQTAGRVPHICPTCGYIRHLKPTDAAKTKQCRHCHCQEIAPLGFAATAERWGRDFAIRAAARKRKEQPSSLEQQVENALRQIPGIIWEREVAVERDGHNPYFVDFAVTYHSRLIALEVNGRFAHRDDDLSASLRLETLFEFFDNVIVLTEDEIQWAECLTTHIQRLISDRGWN